MNRYISGIAVLICCGAVWVGCGKQEAGERSATPSNVLVMDDTGFDSQIAKGVVLVDFWAPWCGPCRMQGPIVEEVASQLQGQAVVAKLNVDDAPKAAGKFSVQSIPTLIVFKGGKPFKQFVGVTEAAELVAAVNAALKAP